MKRQKTKPNLRIPKDVSNQTIHTAGVIGCIMGIFGIHDFMTKRYVWGALHLCSVGLYIVFLCMYNSIEPRLTNTLLQTDEQQYFFLSSLLSRLYGWSLTLMLASQIWGAVEGVAMLNSVAGKEKRSVSYGGRVFLALAALSALFVIQFEHNASQSKELSHAFDQLFSMAFFILAGLFLIIAAILYHRKKKSKK